MSVNVGDVTIKVNYEMTEVSKQLIRGLVAEVLQEALLDDSTRVPFDSKDAVREFIRAEVRKALAEEIRAERMTWREALDLARKTVG
jgi:citrate lyase gamma subunit